LLFRLVLDDLFLKKKKKKKIEEEQKKKEKTENKKKTNHFGAHFLVLNPICSLTVDRAVFRLLTRSTALVGIIARHGQSLAKAANVLENLVVAIIIIDGRFNLAIHIFVFFHHDFVDSIVIILIIYKRSVDH
jgi:hypothetical protein